MSESQTSKASKFENTPENDEKLKEYTLEEIKEHNTDKSIWLIMHNRVYDMTTFLESHPGGPDVLQDVAGTDGTEDFEATYHSKKARDMCLEYLIGKVKDAKLGELHGAVGGEEVGSPSWFLKVVVVLVALSAYIYLKSNESITK